MKMTIELPEGCSGITLTALLGKEIGLPYALSTTTFIPHDGFSLVRDEDYASGIFHLFNERGEELH